MRILPTLAMAATMGLLSTASAIESPKPTVGEQALLDIAGKDLPIIRLWPDKTSAQPETVEYIHDNILIIRAVTQPSMLLFRPTHPDGRAVLVFPGGSYNVLAADHEGIKACEWLNGMGITAFLVKYSVPRPKDEPKHSAALPDGLRAIQLVREQSAQLGIDPKKVGVLGFSAGGHLAALLCHPQPDTVRESIPDFGILVYPAYTVPERGREELDPLLANPKPETTPPIFMTIAANDPFMPGTLLFFRSLRENKIPAEFHIYSTGGHGKGLKAEGYPFSEWVKPCERWLDDQKIQKP
ncbi:MAG: alpha/beta hydrolase [Kiritimatiellales bacterium]|nr:alpha/beta hydrolase [Kiritimatiellales bacterium]MCF7864018.1 alpha/beta hydrolase [Kiritimatiellales bacterium]